MELDTQVLNELRRKTEFVEKVSSAVVGAPGISVDSIKYDVFEDQYGFIMEYLVITYRGGALAARNCRGNSCSAIFEEISRLLTSGAPRDYHDCYAEGQRYLELRAASKNSLII